MVQPLEKVGPYAYEYLAKSQTSKCIVSAQRSANIDIVTAVILREECLTCRIVLAGYMSVLQSLMRLLDSRRRQCRS